MRTSILSRSAVAAATLAVGSVALAAVPATAATPASADRDAIVSIVNAVRDGDLRYHSTDNDPSNDGDVSPGQKAVAALIPAACGLAADHDYYFFLMADAADLREDQGADGAVISTYISDRSEETPPTFCTFGVLATTDKSTTLGGDATLTLTPRPVRGPGTFETAASDDSVTSKLTGNAFVSPSITRGNEFYYTYDRATFAATGTAAKTVTTTGTKKIWDHKSKAEKAAAKAKYAKRIAKAKKAYATALKQAGGDTAKRAAARKAYAAKKAETKVKYDYAVWNYRYVTSTVTTTNARPFDLSASVEPGNFD